MVKKVQSTCNFCAIDCNLDFYVEDGRIIKTVPTKGYPVNDGFSCIKGLSLSKQQTTVKPNALPKIRQDDGSFKEVSWDEGFKHVASKLKELQEKYGRESVAGISTGQLTLEEFAIFGHVMRNFLQTNVDGNTRLCMASAAVAHKGTLGYDAPGYTLNDFELSDTIIFIGANPVVAHPIIWQRVRNNKIDGRKVIVIDPRKSETARNADYHYPLKWRSDLTLMYTLANLIIEKDYVDHDFVDNHTEGYEGFAEFVKAFTLERGSEATGLSKEQILELLELIHNGKAVSFWWTMGVNQGYEAVRTAQSIMNLAFLTGNVGKPGTGGNSITGQCNAMGSRLFSNTTCLFAGGDFADEDERKRIADIVGITPDLIAKKPTIPYNKIIEGINAGEIKGLWILCTNPRHSWTNNETFAEAAKKLELFVVQDIYDTIESAEDCTVYFPVVPGIKKEGTYINMERRLSAMRKVLDRGENEISDYECILGVAKALGMGDAIAKWENPRQCFDLLRECSRGKGCDFTGIHWDDLTDSHGIQWPYPEGREKELSEEQRRLYADGKFFTPSGKAQFIYEEPLENPIPVTDEFPLVFNTGRGSVGQWHTQSRTKEVKFVEDVSLKRAYLYMNTKLAAENDIRDMDEIRVFSSNGQNAVFAVKVTDNVQYGELYAPIHYIECNALTPSSYDKYSREPNYKGGTCRFEKIAKEG
ncbi:MAG: molybdopterin-dependent oxidoreductase [Aeriscardovia sp.]|jgi:assimilatory nitrate reductase catalytic subunit|nr:molybdopterin-dependent oxidoreductase [uncultured Butyrivibrio sp.]MBR4414838.1 molybdopterin-dependent oxidoreductase [Aeriscardovia sp.]